MQILFIHSNCDRWKFLTEARRLLEAVPASMSAWRIEASLAQEDIFRYVNAHLAPILAFAARCVEGNTIDLQV